MTPAYVPAELRRQVRVDAGGRCGYCHTPEVLIGMPLEYEHLYPEALGGPTARENLWLAAGAATISRATASMQLTRGQASG